MEYSMYVCPSCKKVFKVKGNDKNVNCTKCEGMPLLDMHIDEQLWKSYDAITKDKKISQELEGVVIEEYEEESEVDSNTIDTNPIINTAPSNTTQGKSSVIQPKPKKSLICEMCGSTDLMKQEGVFVCQSCGTKYSVEEAKKMMIEGTVDVSGSTVKVDTSDELANLYQIARRAKDDENAENATRYYDMILIKDPTSWEASFFIVYYRATQCKIAQIQSAANSVSNCLDTVLKLIRDHVSDKKEQINAVVEIENRCEKIASMLFWGALNHYNGIDYEIKSNYKFEARDNCLAAENILVFVGDYIDSIFGDYSELNSVAVKAWKEVLSLHQFFAIYLPNLDTNRIQNINSKIQKYDPSYVAPARATQTSSSGSCYVATAVYGSYDCPQVWTLRRYRDFTLSKTWYGRAFIHSYYFISPAIVKKFGHTEWFKKIWRDKLDRMVNKLNSKGYESTPYEDREW